MNPLNRWRVLVSVVVLVAGSLFAADPIVPDLHLSPGVFRKNLSTKKICATKWGLDKRHVTEKMKKEVFAEYGIPESERQIKVVKVVKGKKVTETVARYEIDHLVSRELGGADVVANLWPESYFTQPYNAYRKDRLENHLHKLVCHGDITLDEARTAVAHDWPTAYKKYFGEPTPPPAATPKPQAAKKKTP